MTLFVARRAGKVPGVHSRAPLSDRLVRWLTVHGLRVGLLAAAVLVPVVFSAAQLRGWTALAAVLLALVSLHQLVRDTGHLSLGHAGYVGTGALLAIRLQESGLPLLVVLLLAAVAVGVVAMAVGLAGRLPPAGLAVAGATLVYGAVARDYLFVQDWLGSRGIGPGPAGIGHAAAYRLWLLALVILVGVVAADRHRLRPWLERATRLVRERARAVGPVVDEPSGASGGPDRLHTQAHARSGALAGLAGALIGVSTPGVTGDDFTVLASIALLAIVLAAGPGARLWRAASRLRAHTLRVGVTAAALGLAVAASAANNARTVGLADWSQVWLVLVLVVLTLVAVSVWLADPRQPLLGQRTRRPRRDPRAGLAPLGRLDAPASAVTERLRAQEARIRQLEQTTTMLADRLASQPPQPQRHPAGRE